MTLPEPIQPEPSSAPAAPEAAELEVEAIAIDSLDKENRGWVVAYIAQLRERLQTEQSADQPDFVMIAYLKREVATYQELLERTDSQPG